MGKRKKSGRKLPTKKRNEPLPTSFTCLFCNHESSVSVKMDKKMGVGQLNCKVCGQTFESGITYLSHPVDVYAEWVDACEAVAGEASGEAPKEPTGYRGTARPSGAAQHTETYTSKGNEDGFVVDDEMDAEAEYDEE